MNEKSNNLINDSETGYKLIVNDKNAKKTEDEYFVNKYNINCEEHLKIRKLIPLVKNKFKYCIFIFLNIITFFSINIIIQWYPTILLFIYYSKSTLDKATHIGIYCSKENDTEFEVVELKHINLPKIYFNKPNGIIKNFNLNLPSYNYIVMFEHRLFSYIFNPNNNCFEALEYCISINQTDFLKMMDYGNQLISLSTQLINILNNFQMNNSFQNILEMKNIGFQIYQIGLNIQNVMNSNMGINMMNMPNPINQNLMMNMNMNNIMNPNMEFPNFMQSMENNNNEDSIPKINCKFKFSGEILNIIGDITETIGEILKKYFKRKNLDFKAFENEDLCFLYSGNRIKKNDLNIKLYDFIRPLRDSIIIIVLKTKENLPYVNILNSKI